MASSSKLKIGHKIREAREAKGFTQFQLAELIEKSPEFISLIENNRRLPSLDTLDELSVVLGISIRFFFEVESGKKLAKASTRKKIDSILDSQAEKDLKKTLQLLKLSLGR